MLFNSLQFLIFFPIACLIYFLLPSKVRWIWLLGVSYFYYMAWAPEYAAILALSTLITWLSGLLIARTEDPKQKKWLVALSFLLNLGILFVFKYFRFGLNALNKALRLMRLSAIESSFNILLPAGISFYILQSLSYTMDIYRGKTAVEKNFFRYALFVSFFPTLISGPIERSRDLLPQLRETHSFDYDRVRRGLWRMLWGFFQKLVIADRLALLVDTVYADPNVYPYGGVINFLVQLVFALQIYMDFSGYSSIALGAAEILGFRLTVNFERPFFSVNITEFWTRWHISLTHWFTDYLYIPLGGNRCGKLRQYFNVMVVFLASGLWHGANWTFLVWGGINGLYSVTERILTPAWRRLIRKSGTDIKAAGYRFIQSCYVLLLFSFSQIFFRADSIGQALTFIKGIFYPNFQMLFNGGLFNYGLDRVNSLIAVLGLIVVFLVSWNNRDGKLREKLERQPLPIRWGILLLGIFGVLLFGIYGPGFSAGKFIYAQF